MSNDHGFWVHDGLLETWLLALTREIDLMAGPPLWLKKARDYWYIQATAGFMGCISPNVDDFAISEDRRQELMRVAEQALQRLLQHDESADINIEQWVGYGLRHTTLNTFLRGWSETGHVNLASTAEQFIKLLRGEVTSTVSDVEALSWMQE